MIDREPTREESEQGKANFVVISSTIEEIDCLEMNVRGHRRSLFVWKDGESRNKMAHAVIGVAGISPASAFEA